MTRSGFALRILSRNAEKSVASVGTSSSAANAPPLAEHEALRGLQQIVPERVVGGQAVPLLALDHAVAQQRLPGRVRRTSCCVASVWNM